MKNQTDNAKKMKCTLCNTDLIEITTFSDSKVMTHTYRCFSCGKNYKAIHITCSGYTPYPITIEDTPYSLTPVNDYEQALLDLDIEFPPIQLTNTRIIHD